MPTQTRATTTMGSQDTESLILFLRTLERVLDVTVKTPGLFIPLQFHQTFLAAWEEVQPTVNELIGMIQSGTYNEKLVNVGLSGRQLAMKMAVYQEALQQINSFFLQVVIEPPSTSKREADRPPKYTFIKKVAQKVRNGGRQVMKYVLKPANVILGSLTKAIPFAEILHEFKGGVESALAYSDLPEELRKEKPSKAFAKDWNQWVQIANFLAAIISILPKPKPPSKS